jgi:hypothetical protein
MPDLLRSALAGAALLSILALGACGEDEAKPDPAVLDEHFSNMIEAEEANKNRLVEEARDREDVRKQEMEQRAADYSAGNEAGAAEEAAANAAQDR